ncbi:HlyC/CorC family transporter [Butyrivibrio sp. YAB3001]|uniref:HlyC/CorC family transporter n=1 Tax=Butyrivibrio sp. YAB3001 TaxID=1520812 RepID=UPI0008F638EA|nr:hemolysin family protein [Butyrivibrio sp. YAB3001]SFB74709.1 Hemolysin, contains CBS domains [Butyrivibrio sp. YAB3001]
MNIHLVRLIVLVVLVLLSGFFSSAETAFMTVNRVKVKALADAGNKRAVLVLGICEDTQKMLSAILIGNNIVNLSASALMTVFVTDLWGSFAVGIGTGVLTLVVLIAGEILPKTIATAYSETISLIYARTILFIMAITKPLNFIINGIATAILKVLRINVQSRQTMTENELKTYVDVSHEDGVIESGEKEIIYNVFDFSDAVAKDIMIPRIDMSCVSSETDYNEVMKVFKEEMYTRIPVYEGNEQDNIIGLINIKDLILIQDKENFKITDYLRKAYYTYEYKKTADLLIEMREKSQNVAFVLSEYGTTVGMITLEDLLEEIVGEIRDEYDSDEAQLIKELGDNKYLVEGNMKLDDINDALGTELDSEDYDSIGGLMIENLDRLPRYGETVTLDNGTTLTARGIKRNRITKVLMVVVPKLKSDIEEDDKE